MVSHTSAQLSLNDTIRFNVHTDDLRVSLLKRVHSEKTKINT